MENTVIYIPNTISVAAINSALKNSKHAIWQLYVDGTWNNKEDFDFNKGFHIITVTDSDDMPSIIEGLNKNDIPSYFTPIRFSKRVCNILETDEQANTAYQNTLKNIAYDFVDKLANEGYAKDGSQPTLTAEEREKLTQTILKTAIESMPRKFPTIN